MSFDNSFFKEVDRSFTIKRVCDYHTTQDKRLAFGEFLNYFYRETNPEIKRQMIIDEPEYDNADALFMAEIASAVHKLSNDNDLVCPKWVFKSKYYLDAPNYAFQTSNKEYQEHLKATSPKEYAERNIFLGDKVLKRI